MNKKIYLLLLAILGWAFMANAQTVQISSITAAPGDPVTFDITAESFSGATNVGAVTLYIGYDPNVLDFTGFTAGTLAGAQVNDMGSGLVGILWADPTGVDLSALSTLITLNFNYAVLGGMSDVTFNGGCNLTYVDLSQPTVSFINGDIGPVAGYLPISAGDYTAAPGTMVTVDVTVDDNYANGFNSAAIEIAFDDAVLTYVSTVPGTMAGGFGNAGGGVFGYQWASLSNITVTSGDILFQINFMYNGGATDLVFTDCELTWSAPFPTIIDVSCNNGTVGTGVYPQTMTIQTQSLTPGATFGFTITADQFGLLANDIGAIDLNVGFDPAALTFVGILDGTITGANASLTGPGEVGITWADNAGAGIDGTLLTLQFYYNFGSSAITFNPGCLVTDILLNNIPVSYIDGAVTETGITAVAEIPRKVGVPGDPISFPILVKDFPPYVGAVTLFIGFDDNVLTYNSTTTGAIDGYFANFMPATSQVGIQWFNTAGETFLPEDTLLELNFTYNPAGGWTDITFDMGCEFRDNMLAFIPVTFIDGALILGTKVDVTVFLEGPYNVGTGMMTTAINGILPTTSPFGNGEMTGTIPATATDWMNVELREVDGAVGAATGATMIAEQAGFVLDAGNIVDTMGVDPLLFNLAINDNLYIVAYHRNHIRVLSTYALTMTNVDGYDVFTYDFTTAADQAYNNQHKDINSGIFGMYAGDASQDGNVNLTDLQGHLIPQYFLSGYLSADFDLSGAVNLTDLQGYLIPNYFTSTSIP